MNLEGLPAVNATLNDVSAAFLLAGYIAIKRGKPETHRTCMIAAFVASILFLGCYLAYHAYVAYVLHRGPTLFKEPAWFRPIYLGILVSHTLLATAIVPLSITSLTLGLKNKLEWHKRVSRWTWPIWMYVSVTGVVIYFLLYQIFPQAR